MVTSDKTLSPFAAPSETRSSLRQALPQILAVCVKNVLLLGFGMTLGFPTILIPSLSGGDPTEPISLGKEGISWIGSISLICVPIGCLFSGAATQPIGRKRAMQLVNIPFVTAWLLFYFSTEVWQIFLALCMTGVTGGLLEAPVLTYVAEITQPHLRGMLSSTSTMAVILGVMFQFLLGTFLKWRVVALCNCTLPVLAFVTLFFVPETPVWLITKERYLDARKSIAWLRGWTSLNEIESEFQELCKQLGKANDIGIDDTSTPTPKLDKSEYFKLFLKKNFLWPYGLICLAFFLNHFNGMQTLQTYAIKIFAALKSPIDEYYATVILGVVETLGSVACVTLVHYCGKRVINFISLIGSGCCFVIVATYSYIVDVNSLENTFQKDEKYNWIPTFFLITSAFLSYVGIRVLPWILTGEVYSTETRATASGLSAASGYVFGFLANKLFLSMISLFSLSGTFWFNAAVNFLGALLLYFLLPETEGKTLYAITEHFLGRNKLDNNVRKTGIDNKAFEDEESRTLTYVAEITQPSLRGILASTSTVAVISGILIEFLLGTFLSWKTVALVSISVPILSCTLLFFVPESPHWLISKNRYLDARTSLAWLRGWTDLSEIEGEFKELSEQISKRKEEQTASWKLYFRKNFLWPYSLVSFTFFLGHFSGMTTLQTYAVKIFATLKAPIDKYYATIFLGTAQVFGCILSACLIHFVGKRVMNFLSLFGCGTCFFLAALYAQFLGIRELELVPDTSQAPTNSWIPTTLLIGSAFFTHAGIRILPWMLIGEVYSNETRATGSGLSGGLSYIFGFISNKLFLKIVEYFTLPGTFWFYSGFAFGGLVVLYFVLPETEGKTLFEITEHFLGNGKIDNKVKKIRTNTRGEDNKGFRIDEESEKIESKL